MRTRASEVATIPDWHTYFMNVARVVKTRGNCLLNQVGVVLVQGKRIIATGYNGTPKGVKNCRDGGCVRCAEKSSGKIRSGENKGMCLCVHAEVNAIVQSAYHGTATAGSALYTTHSPCMLCAKEMINAGVQAVYFAEQDENETASLQLLRKHLIEVKKITDL